MSEPFAHGGAAALAALICALLSDPPELARFAAVTVAAVSSSFSTKDLARRFVALVNRLEAES